MSLRDKAAKGLKWTTFSTVFSAFLNFTQMAILAHLLSPVDFGLMGMVLIVVGFGQIFSDMGVSSAIIYRQDTTREQLSSLYWLNIVSGIVACCMILIANPFIIAFYHEPRLHGLIQIASLIFLVTPFGQQYQILLQKELQFNRLAGITILGYLTNAVVSILLAWAGRGVYSLIWGQFANSVVRVMALILTNPNQWRPTLHFSFSDLKGYLGFGFYQMGDKTANYFNVYLIQILLGSMLGAKALGYYTLAFDLVYKPTSAITPIITRVAFPVFSKIQENKLLMKKGYMKVLQLLSSVNFPVTLGMAALAPVAVPVIYGERWMPSVILIQILAFIALLRSSGSPVSALMLGNGKADWGFHWSVGKMVFQIPGLYLGAKLGGAVGATVAFLCLQLAISTFAYLLLIRPLLGSCLKEYLGSMWPALWLSLVMALGIILVAAGFQNIKQIHLLMFQILCGIGIYGALMFLSNRSLMFEIVELVWKKK
ncbi:polysaccharide transporter, PST family [Syntrophus gentianae]|uniref:Polysaccharide transporter, PST family n=1 Tax=Syntrophus gentianae TaxID=43775 RepID=A0A1H7V7E1_9BACT|nr:MOP flippase family protein [Syntrophus gentianae]SEM04838.1 polysaccharide transporter, PST family [Syntrophus gentianae]